MGSQDVAGGSDSGMPEQGGLTGARRMVVNIGYDPLLDDLGDDTGEGHLPKLPPGLRVEAEYDPTEPGLGDDTMPAGVRRMLVVNIGHDVLRSAFG